MKKLKSNNGITLLALIITVIVMMILASATVYMIMNGDNLFNKAKSSVEKWNLEEEKEKVQLAVTSATLKRNGTVEKEYLTTALNEQFGEQGEHTWDYVEETEKYFKIEIKASKRKYNIYKNGLTIISKTLEDYGLTEADIGKTVNYEEIPVGEDASAPAIFTPNVEKGAGSEIDGKDETGRRILKNDNPFERENMNWRILGVNEKGELELISEKSTSRLLCLANEEAYLYGKDELNRMCDELYGKGKYAIGARSLNVEDINKLTNYVPKKGKEYKYRFPTKLQQIEEISGVQYSSNGGKSWNNLPETYQESLRLPGEKEILDVNNSGKEKSVIMSYYSYSIIDKMEDKQELFELICRKK